MPPKIKSTQTVTEMWTLAQPAKPSETEREKVHPKLRVELRVGERGLTATDAEQILGLTWEDDGVKFGPDFLFKGRDSRKARCENNVTNRPLYWSNVEDLLQRIINRRWAGPNGNGSEKINPEPIIVGEYGSVLNGQHQCVALIIAQQTLDDEIAGEKWRANWPGGVVRIDKLVVYGAGEDDAVVNTMDTAKPRSDVDVIYRSPYFADLPPADRRYAAQALAYCVRVMWSRTGAPGNAYHPRKTIEEVVAFLDRHPSLLKAIKHVREEDAGGRLTKLGIRPGMAAAFLYLMAAADSDGESYRAMPHPGETSVDMTNWEKAEEFWTLLASESSDFDEVRYAIGATYDSATGQGGTRQEIEGVLVKAWDVWAADGDFKERDPRLKYRPEDYTTNSLGVRLLTACPIVGGIDVGNPSDDDNDDKTDKGDKLVGEDEAVADGELDEQPEDDPTPAEIEAAKLAILDEKVAAANGKARAPKAPKVKPAANGKPVPTADPVTGRTANNETPQQAKKVQKSKPKKS